MRPPLATVESVRGMRRLAATCPVAARFGLRPEQALAEARAMCPDLRVADADPDADGAALARLAAWCERYSPLAAVCAPDGVWLDITGCAHGFPRGEAELAQDLSGRLARAGLDGRMAVAGAAGAAWALARSPTADGDCTVVAEGGERAALERLPVELLRLDRGTVAGLRRVGLRSIGELARLPRGELAARYGAGVVLRLDQALGRAGEAINWPHPPAPWLERLDFAEPIATPDDLGRALDLLARRLCARLEARERGGRTFAARFFRLDGDVARIAAATARPVRDPAYVARLLRGKLDTLDPGFGVEAVSLAAEETAPFKVAQAGFGDLAVPEEGALATGVDELVNRLGTGRLWRAAPFASHIPERGVRRVPPLMPRRDVPEWLRDPSRPRPIRLFPTPEPIEAVAPVPDDPPILFRWRGTVRRVRAADGPERISPEWWRRPGGDAEHDDPRGTSPDDPVRDYYCVEDTQGARFWIFRAGLIGDGLIGAGLIGDGFIDDGLAEGRMPRWFLHGLFG